jgi:protein-L-isoaspartate(D-aspartate) O-methyltransferase
MLSSEPAELPQQKVTSQSIAAASQVNGLSFFQGSGTSNTELVNNLSSKGIIATKSVFDAMLATDRGKYYTAPSTSTSGRKKTTYDYGAYADAPQAIGHKATISAPYIQATALEYLSSHITKPNSKILDVGCGSGILMAYVSRMTIPREGRGEGGGVVGIEVISELVELSKHNLSGDGFIVIGGNSSAVSDEPKPTSSSSSSSSSSSDAENKNDTTSSVVTVLNGNGWGGAPAHGPFDAIHVGASAPSIPLALLSQLKPGGRMIIPM